MRSAATIAVAAAIIVGCPGKLRRKIELPATNTFLVISVGESSELRDFPANVPAW